MKLTSFVFFCALLFYSPIIVAQQLDKPTPPFTHDQIAPRATVQADHVRRIRIGGFDAEFEKTTLGELHNVLRAGSMHHTGDAAESQYWLCYTMDNDRTWFISHGEMGGSNHVLTEVKATTISPTSRADASCPTVPIKPISFDFGWLGTTKQSLLKTLGSPSEKKNNSLIYYYAGKTPGKYHGQNVEFDVTSYIEVTLTNDKATSIMASHVTSY